MPKQLKEQKTPTGIIRALFRAPIWLYKRGMGWLLGKRFLLINHVGRKSGLLRQAVVEVVDYDSASDVYFVSAGFGPKTQWLQNLLQSPDVTIEVGRRKLAVTAVSLSPTESGAVIVRYATKHPIAIKGLSRVIGYEVDGTEADYYALGAQGILPVIAFQPR